jgi:DNA repair photolyase
VPDDLHEPILVRSVRGRGAVSNPSGRFEPFRRVPFDDGWGSADDQPERLQTTVTPEATRRILASNDSPDIPFDRSINPYKGCEHGCTYCFARPTHAYLGLSPGVDFETRIFCKPEAPELLRNELSRPRYECRPLALGANTDPYQPIERRLGITRGLLEVLQEFRHPVSIVTKSHLVLRDLDLLEPMAAAGRVAVYISITTLDLDLARRMEPRAPTPKRRLEAMGELSDSGVPTGVLSSPMIPALNDHELEGILEAAATAGARTANYILLRLPGELKQLFSDWLRTHYPDRAEKVLGRLRQMRGGELYESGFGGRMRGRGTHADLLDRRFEVACARLGLKRERPRLDDSKFQVPPPSGQGRLFE